MNCPTRSKAPSSEFNQGKAKVDVEKIRGKMSAAHQVQRSLHRMGQVITLHQTKQDRCMGLIHKDISYISLKTKKQCIREISIKKDVKSCLEDFVKVLSCPQESRKIIIGAELLTVTKL